MPLGLKTAPNETDPLRCSLSTVSLLLDRNQVLVSQAPDRLLWRYTALSYTWGDPTPNSAIIVDGRALRVTASLEAALRKLRAAAAKGIGPGRMAPGTDESFWWIDAVCINQADLGERTAQVGLMRLVYAQALAVRVWLGPEADDSAMALDVANQLANTPHRGPGHVAEAGYRGADDAAKARSWRALAALFRRPWWHRAWVRQEVALAKRPARGIVRRRDHDAARAGDGRSGRAVRAALSGLRSRGRKPGRAGRGRRVGVGAAPAWFEAAGTLQQLA